MFYLIQDTLSRKILPFTFPIAYFRSKSFLSLSAFTEEAFVRV